MKNFDRMYRIHKINMIAPIFLHPIVQKAWAESGSKINREMAKWLKG
jgi:hypothetical protein